MAYYARDEQETVINFEYGDKERWRVYSTYPPHIRKLLQIAEIVHQDTDSEGRIIAVDGYVDFNQIWMVKQRPKSAV